MLWQISEEWWGKRAVAHKNALTVTIIEMDSQTLWTIHEDVYLLHRGEANDLAQAQKDAGAKVRRILLSKKLKSWWQIKEKSQASCY